MRLVDKAPPVKLTNREKQILERVLNGQESGEIAKEMKISKRTVQSHRVNLHRAMRTNNVAQLMREAFRLGIIDVTP
jgi:two-component system secretion response regulator SsrB